VRLDPRAPLVLDTRELGRRPGSLRRKSFSAPAPADLGIEVLRVPEGSTVDFELRLEAVMEGVLVTGEARTVLEIHEDLVADFQELFVYQESDTATHGEDEDLRVLEGDLLDLEPLLRDAVVLMLPFQPLCRDDCPGLCIECGARLADDSGHQHDEPVDPRWAALRQLTNDQTD
jgi:uncharacterized protein